MSYYRIWDFILSEEVQNIWGSTLTNRPIMKDAQTSDYMVPLADIKVLEEEYSMTPKELAVLAAKALDGKKGEEIKIMEVTELTTLADYFVICTGSSNTQINALCDAVEEALDTQAGEKPLHREGHRGGIWVLLDYGCLVVHVFNSEAREFYGLERLWNDGKPLDVAALLAE